jgi:hypothetical protein
MDSASPPIEVEDEVSVAPFRRKNWEHLVSILDEITIESSHASTSGSNPVGDGREDPSVGEPSNDIPEVDLAAAVVRH